MDLPPKRDQGTALQGRSAQRRQEQCTPRNGRGPTPDPQAGQHQWPPHWSLGRTVVLGKREKRVVARGWKRTFLVSSGRNAAHGRIGAQVCELNITDTILSRANGRANSDTLTECMWPAFSFLASRFPRCVQLRVLLAWGQRACPTASEQIMRTFKGPTNTHTHGHWISVGICSAFALPLSLSPRPPSV